MSVQAIGKCKYRVVVLKEVDEETGKRKYWNRIVSGSKQDAYDAEAALLVQRGRAPSRSVTLRCLIEDIWLPSLEVASNTYAYYESAARVHIIPAMGGMLLSELTEFNIEEFFRTLPEGSVRVQCKKTLSPALKTARKAKLLLDNPLELADIRIGRGGKRGGAKGYDTYSADECSLLLELLQGTAIEPGAIAMMCAGARREEAAALDWEDFDAVTGRAPVEKAYIVDSRTGRAAMKGPKNDESWRDLIFKGYALERMRELSRGRSGPMMEFQGKRMRPDLLYGRWKALVEGAGVRYLPVGHLRHTFATQSLLSGTDPATLRDLMGHSELSTILERYLKPLEEEREKAQERLGAVLAPKADRTAPGPWAGVAVSVIRGGKAPSGPGMAAR